jgi:DNA polymerase-3 subunit gamma/tau
MSYQVLARKWRPRRFTEMVGQTHVLRALVNALDTGRLHHAYLFSGTRGVGKTSLARVFAKALNCEKGISSDPCGECAACTEIDEGRFFDLIEVDAASRTKVDETRELLENVPYAPTRGRFKVYLIDEVHMFSNHSFNALLKTLEEPPPHVKFLLATTDPKRLPVTVLSRCLQFNLTRLTFEQLRKQLEFITSQEGISTDPESLEMLAVAADGSVRDALSLLDQAIAFGDGELREADIGLMLGAVGAKDLGEILEALADKDGGRLIDIARSLADSAPDFNQVLNELLSLISRVAIFQAVGEQPVDQDHGDSVKTLAGRLTPEDCQLFYQIGLMGRRDLSLAPDPQTGFEMTLLRMLAFCPAGVDDMAAVTSNENANQPTAREQMSEADTPAMGENGAQGESAATPGPASDGQTQTPGPMDWFATVEALEAAGLVRELARNCALRSFDGAVLDLIIAPQYENLRAERHVRALEAALRQQLNTDLRVRLSVEEAEGLATPSQLTTVAQAERQRAAEQQMEQDPTVQELKDTFGAKIESVSVR